MNSLKGFGCDKMLAGITAGGALMYHMKQNLSSLQLQDMTALRVPVP